MARHCQRSAVFRRDTGAHEGLLEVETMVFLARVQDEHLYPHNISAGIEGGEVTKERQEVSGMYPSHACKAHTYEVHK